MTHQSNRLLTVKQNHLIERGLTVLLSSVHLDPAFCLMLPNEQVHANSARNGCSRTLCNPCLRCSELHSAWYGRDTNTEMLLHTGLHGYG